MPPQSVKISSASASRSSSKRPAGEVPARQSKRARATARKSYADPETDTEEGVDELKNGAVSSEDNDEVVASDYEEHSNQDTTSESEHEEVASDDDIEAAPRGRPAKSAAKHSKYADEKELWKPGAKLEPGMQLIIKKPKARDAGDTPYADNTIHPNTMLFLKDLNSNNDRQWLKRK
jgi:hypothetical protein